jgi:hypothetical protein
MEVAGQVATGILVFLKECGWETNSDSIPADLMAGSFLSTELDAINMQAVDILGDALLFEEDGQLVVSEDYRDEIAFILEHPEYVTPNTSGDEVDIYSTLDEDWAAFARQMDVAHWATLAILYVGTNEPAQLAIIARSVYSTPAQLIDAINEFADDTIGDIVIDTLSDPLRVEEEYRADIQVLLRWAAQMELLEAHDEA